MICHWQIGLFQRKPKQEGLKTYFFEKLLESLGLSLYLWKFQRKQSFTPENFTGTCALFLQNSKAINQDPGKFYMIFSWSPMEIPLLFYLTPGNPNALSSAPLEISIPQTLSSSLFGLFWSSPFFETWGILLHQLEQNSYSDAIPIAEFHSV